ncbi:MAG: protein kinase [Anaerolineales bacterium]|jgi:serine/threonine protein kinase
MTLTPGDLLHIRYRIIGIIGRGGMGAVYRGEDAVLLVPVAIKENLNPLPQAVKQFKREALLLATLRHSNLPRVTDHFIEGDLQYLIMDYVPGDDLKTILEQQGAIPESQVMSWCGEICDALTYLHTQHPPVTHRDIKPANIKITPEGKPVLVDFGIAKASEAGGVTTTGARSLTPGFAPPEQYGSSPTDSRTDQYSLAATLYNLLTGQIPPDSLDRTLSQAPLKSIRELIPKLSPAVDRAILKAMSLSPSDRFASVKDFLAALKGEIPVSETSPDTVTPASREPLTVIRRTREEPTLEKIPGEPFAGAELQTPGRFRPTAPLLAGIGAVLCLLATGIAVGGYALSGGFPSVGPKNSPAAIISTSSTASPTNMPSPTAADKTNTPAAVAQQPTAEPVKATPEPTAVGGGSLLAFVSNRNGQRYQIYTYNLLTKEIRQLTSDAANKGRVAWSPDGLKIFYESAGADGKKDIFVMNADGTSPVNLTNTSGDDAYPAVSPKTGQVAFVSSRNSWMQIWWMQPDGSNPINVSAMHTNKPFNMPQEWDPAWAPDGSTMYFILNVTGATRVYRWDSRQTNSDPVVVTMMAGDYIEADPAVSPNGDFLAYTRIIDNGSELCVVTTDLSKRAPCASPLTDRLANSDPDWSPDGQWIAYMTQRGGNFDIYLMMITGGGKINLTDDPANDKYPAWQPIPA